MADIHCDLCGEEFGTAEELDRHLAERHAGEDAGADTAGGPSGDELAEVAPGRIEVVPRLPDSGYYECDECGKRFPVYRDFTRHLEKAHGRKEGAA